jgi:hypothetical protein
MSWFTNLFTGPLDKIVTSVGEAIDRNVTTDHERLKLANELEQIRANAKLEAAKLELEAERVMEGAVTERWQADMQSDDPLAKRVRPLALIYLLLFMTIVILADSFEGLEFNVKDVYVDLIQALLLLVFGAYYGGRSLEKILNRKR